LEEKFRLTPESEEARYRSHRNQLGDPDYMAYLSRTAQPVVERLPPGAQGIDYGCGPVEGMKNLLSPQGFSVDSYDPFFFPDEKLLNIRYDFALCSEAAEHFFSPQREFARLSSLVRPGGWLGVSSALAGAREAFPGWWYRRDPTHVAFYTEETVRWIARRFGWRVERLESPLWLLEKE
jgi:hypothetical protein